MGEFVCHQSGCGWRHIAHAMGEIATACTSQCGRPFHNMVMLGPEATSTALWILNEGCTVSQMSTNSRSSRRQPDSSEILDRLGVNASFASYSDGIYIDGRIMLGKARIGLTVVGIGVPSDLIILGLITAPTQFARVSRANISRKGPLLQASITS